MSERYALRVLPSWPWAGSRPGQVVVMPLCTARDDVERVRAASANGEHYEVVQIDDNGNAIEATR